MRVLGIDTATLACSVAVTESGKVLADYTLLTKKTHSERLLPLVVALLGDIGLTASDLGGVAVAVGPGSFTGIRIGVATARALGQALKLSLVGVSTLEALASQADYFPGLVSPILDARRSQVYNAVFRTGCGRERLCPDRVLNLEVLLSELAQKGERVLFPGDGVPHHRLEILVALGEKACFPPPEGLFNRAAAVARLGQAVLEAGKGVSYPELLPRYIRKAEAEVKYLARCRQEGGTSSQD